MAFALSSLYSFFSFPRKTGGKIDCYHCSEKMHEHRALTVNFNGITQPVCCHGCLAILKTIEKNGMIAEYLQAKSHTKTEA
ncbi:heavy metal translocating P-type ATPase metal-binding domain-containing protein [Undibacterium sp. SXout7W]|uniref:heavy metal translocating P-type ATPase metal-binding domain-containing protein n=1 Tax=Undibacterium sp. SXout7W TaxID=3413049 RepID=UPI003BEFC396